MEPSSQNRTNSMVSFTIGRVINTLLTARPKKIESAISHLAPDSTHASLESVEEALRFLHKFFKDAAAEGDDGIDQVLVPMMENSLKHKESKHGGQEMIILNWLFQDEAVFQNIASNLANIILRKEDRYIALGWCTLVRGLVEFETSMDRYLTYGIKERYKALLNILCSCVSHLSLIMRSGSTEQGGFELPTRLSVSAADCVLAITCALTKKEEVLGEGKKSSKSNSKSKHISLVSSATNENKYNPAYKPSIMSDMEMEHLLWNQLGELIYLLQRLHAWNRKSRPLHAIGLEHLLKWLQGIQQQYGCVQDEAGSKNVKSGLLLLSSCWKHYSKLLHLEDRRFSHNYKDLLDQYLSGIQFYTDNYTSSGESREGGTETRKFFLNCLCLLLGRLDAKKFEIVVAQFGAQLSHILLQQLHCDDDEDMVEVVVCIFREIIFKPEFLPESRTSEGRNLDAVLPLLVNLLDERDGTSKAVSVLIAEYCTKTMDEQCLNKVLERLASENILQRRNAVDVISRIVHITSASENKNSHVKWKDIIEHLLERLADAEYTISEQVSSLLPMIDPFLVVPSLVTAIYLTDNTEQSAACNALVRVLEYHNQKTEVICNLLDCVSNPSHIPQLIKARGDADKGSTLDNDPVLKLIPEWSKTVRDWNCVSGPLIEKMFADPSNAVIVRFLSYISEQLADAADVVLHRVLLKMEEQKELDKTSFLEWENKNHKNEDYEKLQQTLFDRLCPLLVIKLLPLRVFDLNSSFMYGELLGGVSMNIQDFRVVNINEYDCIAAFLVSRALCKFEFEDVRKVAAELSGRIHPQVLFPVVSTQLQSAIESQDILRIKALLFSLCTSFVIRGGEPITNPCTLNIRKKLELVLLWPSLEGDAVSKAQHGCIDCLALMICSEMQAPDTVRKSNLKRHDVGNKCDVGDATVKNSVLTYVIHQLTCTHDKFLYPSTLDTENSIVEVPVQIPFRLCMANVLISACQKMSERKGKFAKKVVPHLIHSVETIEVSDIRAACIQVLFSAVYHLKSAVVPFSSDLIGLALRSLKAGSEKEKMAGAKLVASLMASEDSILGSISGEILEARVVLSSVSSGDPSPEIRQLCRKLLACITS